LGALPIRQGHFLLESGLHAQTWIDLDALFIDPAALAPQIAAVADLLHPYQLTAVCGPLLGGAFVAQAIATHLGLRFYYAERIASDPRGGLFEAVYRLPKEQRLRAPQERFAVVDDIVSAGSSVRATVAELSSLGAETAVIGALMVLGSRAASYFAQTGLSVVAPAWREFVTWEPGDCPYCQAGVPLQNPGS
jgi:orotate phosphoribosyltransferase